MTLRGLHYDWPSGAYLLFVVFALMALLWGLYEYRRRALLGFAAAPSLAKLLVPRSRLLYLVKGVLLCGVWVAATVALMGPQGGGRYATSDGQDVVDERLLELQEGDDEVVLRRKAHDVVFLIDASASMAVTDTRLGKTRLAYAKEIVDEVVSHLEGQNVALYAFTSEVTTVVPLTLDYLFFRLMTRQVDINEGDVAGTDLVEALETVRQKHFATPREKLTTLVLLTDGGDTRLEALEGEKRTQEMGAILSRIGDAAALNLRIFTVGLGSKEGEIIPDITFEGQQVRSSLDEQLLIQLSEKGRGRYYFGNDFSALSIANDLVRMMGQDEPFVREDTQRRLRGVVERQVKPEGGQEVIYDLFFQYPLGLAMVLLSLVILLPDVRKKRKIEEAAQ